MSNHTVSASPPTVPNHHADYPAFRGPTGMFAALSMLVGRRGDAALACDLAELCAGERVLDIGCGPGTAARHAARRGADVVGVDPAEVMLRIARAVPARGRARWLAASAEKLPLAAGSFEVVWSIASVHHWRDLPAALAEIDQVLVPAGRFVAIERRILANASGHASHGWTATQAEAFAQGCRNAGFVAARVTEHKAGRRPLIAVACRKPEPAGLT